MLTLFDFGEVSPFLSPINAMLIQAMLPRAAPGLPTLVDVGGEEYDKWRRVWLL